MVCVIFMFFPIIIVVTIYLGEKLWDQKTKYRYITCSACRETTLTGGFIDDHWYCPWCINQANITNKKLKLRVYKIKVEEVCD